MEISRERLNEISHAILILELSGQSLELNPDKLKRKLGNLPVQLEKVGVILTKEELQWAVQMILEDLFEYAFKFNWEEKNKDNRKSGSR